MSSVMVKEFRPYLTLSVKERLDSYVEEKLGDTEDGIAILSYKKNLLEPLFPGLSRPMIAVALSAYADLARERWRVEYHRTSNNPYHLMAHKNGRKKDTPLRIHGTDFDAIRAYLGFVFQAGRIVIVSDRMLEEAGYALETDYRQRWLLMNTFFGLHPEYPVLGTYTRYDHRNLRYEMIFMVTDDPDRSSLNKESVMGIFQYLLRGKVPVSRDGGRADRPGHAPACDAGRAIPAEAEVLERMRGRPATVKELAQQTSSSETLVRLALKRLYVRGLITVAGRRDGAVGRAPYLYRRADEPGKEAENVSIW